VKGEAKVWEAASLDVTRAALEALATAAAGGEPYPVTLEQAIHGVAATEAIIRSAASGKVEQVG
jgi:predicted dehydrogenase